MAQYRIPELDLATRIDLALAMLPSAAERGWGRATELARQHGVSRQFLYTLGQRAAAALDEALLPRAAGRPAQVTTLTVDKPLIDRTIALLPMLTGSVRDIRLGLDLILGVKRSVGYVSETLMAAGEQATAYNLSIRVPLPILGEADEIFQGRQPCLTLVDGRSFLVLNLTPAASRDATTWGLTYLDQVERGVQFHDLACDGGTGLRAGAREAELAVPLRPDLFHVMQDGHHLTQQLERRAYKALAAAERARRGELEAQGLIRRRGPRLKITVPLPQATVAAAQAMATCDHWQWLLGEIRQALEPITPSNGSVSVAKTRATLNTALVLLKELKQAEITAFAADLEQKLAELLAPLAWLEQHLTPLLQDLDADTQAFIFWAWQHRQALHLNIEVDMPESLRPIVRAIWEVLGLFHRSSSLAESLHSWLRPHLQVHRGMPKWLLPLLQLFWNHHRFERGKRAGNSPLELAGVADAPSLADVLGSLFSPSPSAQPA